MNTILGKLMAKLLFWCVIELTFNALGMDSLADDGEFLSRRSILPQSVLSSMTNCAKREMLTLVTSA
jgi:hypothetical protein